jgi:hypothetical protein
MRGGQEDTNRHDWRGANKKERKKAKRESEGHPKNVACHYARVEENERRPKVLKNENVNKNTEEQKERNNR